MFLSSVHSQFVQAAYPTQSCLRSSFISNYYILHILWFITYHFESAFHKFCYSPSFKTAGRTIVKNTITSKPRNTSTLPAPNFCTDVVMHYLNSLTMWYQKPIYPPRAYSSSKSRFQSPSINSNGQLTPLFRHFMAAHLSRSSRSASPPACSDSSYEPSTW
jgi:hypothetical protein